MKSYCENIGRLISYSDGGILSKVLHKNNKISVTLFCMAKETEMSEHASTKEAIVFVIEGAGIFILEGEEVNMTKDIAIFMKKNSKHSIKAYDNTSFILFLYN